MKRKIWIGITIIVVVALSLVLVINHKTKKEPGEIKIGAILPLTGPAANHGEDARNAILLALGEINNKAGVNSKKIQIKFEDNMSTPNGSVNAAKKLVEIDGVNIIIGPISSSGVLACAPIIDKAEVVLFSPTASSPKISGISKFVFRNSLLATPQGQRIADFCVEEFGREAVGILYINDDTGESYYNSFKKAFEHLRGKISFVDKYDKIDTDFRTQIAKFKNKGIKVIYVPAIPRTMGLLIKQSYELGYNPVFLGNIGVEGEDLLINAGDLLDSNLYYTSLPIKEEFLIKYSRKYSTIPKIAAPLAYDAMHIIALSIKESMKKDIEVKVALNQIKNYEGVTGLLKGFDENGDAIKQPIIKTVKNRNFVILEDSDL